jgi:predicted lipoprotein
MARDGNSRRYVRIGVLVGILAALIILWFTGLLATVKPIGTVQSLEAVMEGGTAFDKVKFVDSVWGSKVVPTVEKDAISLDKLFPALQKNADEAAKEYGNNVGGAYNFLVQFSGKVSKVDSNSLTGTVAVDAEVTGGSLPVRIQIGPIILGTALRDAVKFITFQQFTNQMQFGGVSDEINKRVSQEVISKLNLKSLGGRTLSVKGAFTYDEANAKDILVTPVIVTQE